MKKLHSSKAFLKMAGGKMHTPYPPPLYPLQAISHGNHQKSLAYFSHLAPLILFFFTKKQSQKRRAWHNAPSHKYAPDLTASITSILCPALLPFCASSLKDSCSKEYSDFFRRHCIA